MPKSDKKPSKSSEKALIPAWTNVAINQAVLVGQNFTVLPWIAKKKALIVGIDDYAPVGSGGPDLHGCVNEACD